MKPTKNVILSIVVILFTISACVSNTQPTVKETDATPTLPLPTEGKGVVCGTLIDNSTGKAPESNLFLSPNITAGRDDVPAMMSFSFQTNPRAEMSPNGYFCFEDVEPNQYAITLWSPPDKVEFIEAEDGQDYLWVNVEPGSLIDLGQITK